MDEKKWLAEKFEAERPRLRAVAQRLLGSRGEAEDAVQEAWLRLARASESEIENLGAWLTTVVARIALNQLRSRKQQARLPELVAAGPTATGLEHVGSEHLGAGQPSAEDAAVLASSVGLALFVVLDTLSPSERVAFVLHDVFGLPFEEVARILDQKPEATRQLASRARRRVQARKPSSESDLSAQQSLVQAFADAARDGNVTALVAILAPDVLLRSDRGGPPGRPLEVRGADQVARRASSFSQLGLVRVPIVVEGAPGLLSLRDGAPFSVMTFTIRDGQIVEIDIVTEAGRVAEVVGLAG